MKRRMIMIFYNVFIYDRDRLRLQECNSMEMNFTEACDIWLLNDLRFDMI